MIICGYKKITFKAKDTNEEITGYNVYTLDEFGENSTGYGCISDKVFVSVAKFEELDIHNIVKNKIPCYFLYNKFGKVTSVVPL